MKNILTGLMRKKTIILFVALISVVAGSILLSKTLSSYIDGVAEAKKLKSLYEDVQDNNTYTEPTKTRETVMEGAIGPDSSKGPEKPKLEEIKTVLPRYGRLLEVNNEVAGWIRLEGTRIDYPFMQHNDNDYYLHTDIENKESKRGCVFIDYRNNKALTDKNTLIYAHNMRDGSMFKDLVLYKKKDFFYSHKTIHIDSLYEESNWEVFSVYVVDANKETINVDYSAEGSFLKEVNAFKERSMYKTDVQFGIEDRIVTLVTCSYETSNARTIVHAKYIKAKQ